jgi:hypothetical protein
MFFQEYSLIMSERDSVHKEIEKLQDEVQETKRKMNLAEGRTKLQDDEVVFFFFQLVWIQLIATLVELNAGKCKFRTFKL